MAFVDSLTTVLQIGGIAHRRGTISTPSAAKVKEGTQVEPGRAALQKPSTSGSYPTWASVGGIPPYDCPSISDSGWRTHGQWYLSTAALNPTREASTTNADVCRRAGTMRDALVTRIRQDWLPSPQRLIALAFGPSHFSKEGQVARRLPSTGLHPVRHGRFLLGSI